MGKNVNPFFSAKFDHLLEQATDLLANTYSYIHLIERSVALTGKRDV